MKRILFLLAFLVLYGMVAGNGNRNGNHCSNSFWGRHWPGYVVHWLEIGGEMPRPLALEVIREARNWGNVNFGLSLGQMVQAYNNGELVIEHIAVVPPLPVLVFRVSYGGGQVIVDLENSI